MTPSDLLTALAQDLINARSILESLRSTIPAEETVTRHLLQHSGHRLDELQTCVRFHPTLVSFAPIAPPPTLASGASPAPTSTTRPYRDAACQAVL